MALTRHTLDSKPLLQPERPVHIPLRHRPSAILNPIGGGLRLHRRHCSEPLSIAPAAQCQSPLCCASANINSVCPKSQAEMVNGIASPIPLARDNNVISIGVAAQRRGNGALGGQRQIEQVGDPCWLLRTSVRF